MRNHMGARPKRRVAMDDTLQMNVRPKASEDVHQWTLKPRTLQMGARPKRRVPDGRYVTKDDTFRERSCEGHGRHLGRSGRFFEDEGHRKHRRKLRRTTTHFNSQTTEWKLPTVIEGHMWRSLMVA